MKDFDKEFHARSAGEQGAQREIIETSVKTVVSAVITFVLLLLACAMCGCKTTEYVPVETVRTEYKDRINTEYVVDSVVNDRFVYINGDTVFVYKWRDRWRTEIKRDSIYINKTDTISVPYPVEKKLTKWEKAKMDFGGIAFGGVIVAVAVITVLAWLARKRRK